MEILEAILKYVLLPFVPVGFSIALSLLKLLKQYSRRWRYAFKTLWAKISIGVNALTSLLIYEYLLASGLTIVPASEMLWLNALFLSILSAALATGIVSRIPIKGKSTSGAQTVIDTATWIHETLQAEIQQLVDEEIVAFSLQMQKRQVNIQTLAHIGNEIVRYKFKSEIKKKNAELAKIDELVGEQDLSGLIEYIMNCNNSDPEWIQQQVEMLERTLPMPTESHAPALSRQETSERIEKT